VDKIENMINPGMGIKGAEIEVPGPSKGLDRHNRSVGWLGPTRSGLLDELLCHLRPYGPQEGARNQDRRAMTIAARQDGHRAFGVIMLGW
jgi:hypothetical protein